MPVDRFREHVFGVVILNDWSARDLQAWEYVPLGPFLGKSFATSISAWVLPLAALDGCRDRPAGARRRTCCPTWPGPAPAYAIDVEVGINGHRIATCPYAAMYYTPAQMLAHLTVNGASLRTGDLFGSGTISGPEPDQRGSLLELTWNGTEPLDLGGQATNLPGGRRRGRDAGDHAQRRTAGRGARPDPLERQFPIANACSRSCREYARNASGSRCAPPQGSWRSRRRWPRPPHRTRAPARSRSGRPRRWSSRPH